MAEMLALEAAPGFESALALAPPPPPPSTDDAQPADEPADAPSNEKKTLADLAREVSSWTLHSDHELHAFLKQYSADLFARTKELEDSVRDIAAEADAAHVRLKNTFNQFLMLSNNQFIENRVYDEEQEDFFGVEAAPEKEKTEEKEKEKEKETDASAESKDGGTKAAAESIVSKYRSALDMGMEAMKLFVMMDEEEDDKSDTSSQFDTVLDIYNERPLPFIIGTREFLEDEALGLGAAPEDYSDSDSDSSYGSSYSSSDSDSASDASSATREERRSSHSRSRSRYRSSSEESDESSVAAPPPRRRADSDESDTSGLFGRPPVVEPPRRNSSKRLTPRRSDSFDSSSSDEEDELFGSAKEVKTPTAQAPPQGFQLPPMGETTSKESKSLESKKSFLSSDSDAESTTSGLFGRPSGAAKDTKKPPAGVSVLPPPQQSRRLDFSDDSSDDEDDGLFGAAPAKPTTPVVVPPTAAIPPPRRRTFSVSSSDDDEGLFGAKPKASPVATPAPVSAPGSLPVAEPLRRNSSKQLTPQRSDSLGSSSSDEEDGLFGSAKEEKTPTAQAPPQGFQLPPMGETTLKESKSLEPKKSFLSSDSDAESTTSGLFGRPSGAKATKKSPGGVSVLLPPQQSRRLDFSDDSSDDEDGGLFGAAPAKPTMPVATPVAVLPTAAIPPPRRPTYSDSSSDDDDDDDGGLFGAKPKAAPVAAPAPASAPGSLFGHPGETTPIEPKSLEPKRSFLSSDSDAESTTSGLFGRPFGANDTNKSPAGVSVLSPPQQSRRQDFSDDSSGDEDGGLFGAAPAKPTMPVATPVAVLPTAAIPPPRRPTYSDSSSDDDDDDDGGLFGAKPKAAPVATPAPVSAPGSLFGPLAGTAPPVVHPPIPSAAARMRAAESDSDSDWDGDGGLFGHPKK
ncbi:hypothetical protein PF011_g22918 [Phytophthora fragariae]|uniref:FAM21/CAPZIP domain-containing protein n=1 Tax=Phytophthora fragariae TaxID=53985 RepID=A0A6A3I8W8_9STRA|nr:hypothetical protein PF011_g22918 [Phytophthora fragariae]